MNKLIVCQTATILCGLLAFVLYFSPDVFIGKVHHHKLMGEAFGLLNALFGTQWVEYANRLNKKLVPEPVPNLDMSTAIGD